MTGIGKPEFNLVDHFGEKVTENSFPGRGLLVYFGFTHCKVVCPRSLARLNEVFNAMSESLRQKLQVLYITVDPERDTPSVMRRYLEKDYPLFLGLTGSSDQIAAAKSAFKVFAQRRAGSEDPEGYEIAHTAITYFIGPDGEYITHWPDVKATSEVVEDLERWGR